MHKRHIVNIILFTHLVEKMRRSQRRKGRGIKTRLTSVTKMLHIVKHETNSEEELWYISLEVTSNIQFLQNCSMVNNDVLKRHQWKNV